MKIELFYINNRNFFSKKKYFLKQFIFHLYIALNIKLHLIVRGFFSTTNKILKNNISAKVYVKVLKINLLLILRA